MIHVQTLTTQPVQYRVGGAAAFFDMQKLLFTNGHYLRSLPQSELNDLIGQEWVRSGIIKDPHSDFAKAAAELLAPGLKHINTADQGLEDAISYPLEKTMQREESWKLWDQRIAERVIAVRHNCTRHDGVSGPCTVSGCCACAVLAECCACVQCGEVAATLGVLHQASVAAACLRAFWLWLLPACRLTAMGEQMMLKCLHAAGAR